MLTVFFTFNFKEIVTSCNVLLDVMAAMRGSTVSTSAPGSRGVAELEAEIVR